MYMSKVCLVHTAGPVAPRRREQPESDRCGLELLRELGEDFELLADDKLPTCG
jgi:hypothetical protein